MMKDIIVIEDLHKYYGSTKAVYGLNLKVKRGEIYGLLGPNGAGKSTAIKSILGLLEINAGKIAVLGIDPIKSPSEVKKNIGYVPEEPELYESMSVKELFEFIASIRKMNAETAARKAREYLISLDALKYAEKFIGGLSRGNKQKIQIVAALIHDPKVLILDEPLSGLDARSTRVLKEIFQMHIERGGAIILSTHIMEQAQVLCDRIGIINEGMLIAEGTFEELQGIAQSAGAPSLEEIFLQLTGQAKAASDIIEKLRLLNMRDKPLSKGM